MSESYKIGQRVEVVGKEVQGSIAFYGPTQFASGRWIGLILDGPKGKNNGTVRNHTYFQCDDNYGMFVRPPQVILLDGEGKRIEPKDRSDEVTPSKIRSRQSIIFPHDHPPKRKRNDNTSRGQYDIYLRELENDFTFRNCSPRGNEAYFHTKWDNLTSKLNNCESGPSTLTAEEWRKRFSDWKNSTRCKARRIKDQTLKNGSTAARLKLTDLEMRGLVVWGKGPLELTEFVDETDGLRQLKSEGIFESAENSWNESVKVEPVEQDIVNDIQNLASDEITDEIDTKNEPLSETSSYENHFRRDEISGRFEHFIAEFIDSEHRKIEMKARKLKLEEQRTHIDRMRLEFEIAKFKYLHPGFSFEMNK